MAAGGVRAAIAMVAVAVTHVYLARASEGVAPSSLRLVVALYRHGERTPVLTCPTDANTAHFLRTGLGQLTVNGMRMHYELGSFLRRHYSGFLHERYHRNYTVVRAANYDRTLMSAQVNLAALYPPAPADRFNSSLAWQPIPIHTVPLSEDLLMEFPSACARYSHEMQKLLQTPKVRAEIARLAPVFRFLTEKCGIPVHEPLTAMYIYDLLSIEQRLGLPLPAWHSAQLPPLNTPLFPDQLRAVNQLSFSLLSGSAPLRRLGGGAFLAQFISDMSESVSAGERLVDSSWRSGQQPLHQSRQLVVYSGHDADISAVLGTMGLLTVAANGETNTSSSSGGIDPSLVTPALASCLLLELHQLTPAAVHYVHVLFRAPSDGARPRRLPLPGCQDAPDGGCLWRSFLRLYASRVPDDIRAECASSSPAGDDNGDGFWGVGDMLALVVYFALSMVSVLSVVCCLHRVNKIPLPAFTYTRIPESQYDIKCQTGHPHLGLPHRHC